jgi:hypothetical protein
VQSQQLPTESQVLEDEVLSEPETADQPTEEMSERHDQLFAKSFILQVYDALARHSSCGAWRICSTQRASEGGSPFAKRQLPGFGVMLHFWGMGDSMIRTVILMAFALT